MNIVYHKGKPCASCGNIAEISVVVHTETNGEFDLDMRPSAPARFTMDQQVTECPHCGYVNVSIDQEIPNWKETLSSRSFKRNDGIKVCSPLARKLIRYAVLNRQGNVWGEVLKGFVYASWACDDNGERKAAKECRKRAVQIFNDHDCVTCLVPENDAVLLRADVLRKAGYFKKVLAQFNEKRTGEAIIDKCLAFEVELATKKDLNRYYVDLNHEIRINPVPEKIIDKGSKRKREKK